MLEWLREEYTVGKVKWGKAIAYGIRFFLMSAVFTIAGLVMLASALSVKIAAEGDGAYVLSVNVSALSNLGALILAVMGLTVLVIGNAASFFKVLSELLNDSSSRDYFW